MATVLIVYYSRTGNTEAMARAVTEGAKFEGVEVVLKRVDYANVFDVSFADAVAFGSPCHFGYMAGALKAFFDRLPSRNSKFMEQMRRTPAAAFVCDGETDGAEEALLSIEKMLFYYFSFKYVCKGVVCKGKPSESKLQECRKLGQRLAKAVLSSARAS